MKRHSHFATICTVVGLVLTAIHITQAGSATWNLNPSSGDWNTAGNWTPATVPNATTDIATFSISNVLGISVSAPVEVDSVNFSSGGSGFTITAQPNETLTLSGAGITNDSGIIQTFVAADDGASAFGTFAFANNATAGSSVQFTSAPSGSTWGGRINFLDTANAGSGTFISNGGETTFYGRSSASEATFINNGNGMAGGFGGFVAFRESSNADHATLTNNATLFHSGTVIFYDFASAGHATITNQGALVGNFPGDTTFYENSTAAQSTIIGEGSSVSGAKGAYITFAQTSSAGKATVIANGGTNGGLGAVVLLEDESNCSNARFILSGNASILNYNGDRSIGSLEGEGDVSLFGRNLSIGANGQNTSFAGVIEDGFASGASLTKVGLGTLTLSGASTYTGGTTVAEGTLVVNNTTGSATGTGAIAVAGGTLGGSGIIPGVVTIGTGTGTAATLAPGAGARFPLLFNIQNSLTFKADGTYAPKVYPAKSKADQVIARAVTIESGATFSLRGQGAGIIPPGTVFLLIKNFGFGPLRGNFSNLPDGGTIAVGSNTFQANYEGGDGNDLTLTVVP